MRVNNATSNTEAVIDVIDKLKPELARLNRRLDHSINRGGCGIFAQHYREFLKKKFNIKPQVIVLTYQPEIIKKAKDNNILARAGKEHIVLKVDDKFLDVDGVYDDVELGHAWGILLKKVTIPVKLLKKWNSDQVGWNPTFIRDEGIPLIKETFETLITTLQ